MSVSAWIIGAHLLTAHASGGMESVTPGVYARAPNGATVGAYRNSYGRPTAYAGWTFEHDRYALTVAAATGYQRRPVYGAEHCAQDMKHTQAHPCFKMAGLTDSSILPMVVPSVRLPSFGSITPRLSLVGFKSPAIHLSLEY